MLDRAPDRVALDRLRQSEFAAPDKLQIEQHVRAIRPQCMLELAARERHVPRVGAMAVQHRGHLARAAGAAGAALAELGARFGNHTDLGHD